MLFKDMLSDVTGRLGSVISSKEFAGELIEIGDVKIVPMLRLHLGFGGGGAEGDANLSNGKGSNTGGDGGGVATMGGVCVRPVGVIVLTKNGVRVLQVKERQSTIERILDTVPETVERIKGVVRRLDTEDGAMDATATAHPLPEPIKGKK